MTDFTQHGAKQKQKKTSVDKPPSAEDLGSPAIKEETRGGSTGPEKGRGTAE